MSDWAEIPHSDTPEHRGGGVVTRFVPPLVVAALLWLLGHRRLAVLVVVLGSGVAIASAISPAFARLFDRALVAIGHWIGRALTFVLLGLFELFIVAPVAFLAWVFRRDPLATHPRPRPGGLWRPRDPEEPDFSNRIYALEPRPERGAVGRVVVLIPRVVGWIAILVAVDLAIGSLTRSDADATVTTNRLAEATADAPWFDEYRDELEAVQYEQDPFLLSLPVDHDGEYINVEGGHRRTVLPEGTPNDAPVVWVFGGSPAWGEGQRDEHTIPSELAAVAAEGGTPIRVVNWAQRGDSAFVGAQRLERALAHEEAPALVVALDGPDDFNIQAEFVTGHPSQYNLEAAQQSVHADRRSLFQRYEDTSIMFEVGQRIRSVFAMAPAYAQDDDEGGDGGNGGEEQVVTPVEIADSAASVYLRGRDLADIVAELSDVPVEHFWLPVADSGDRNSTYQQAARRLDDGVTVIEALDEGDGPVFLDGVHTNEAGARQVAEVLYAELQLLLQGDTAG